MDWHHKITMSKGRFTEISFLLQMLVDAKPDGCRDEGVEQIGEHRRRAHCLHTSGSPHQDQQHPLTRRTYPLGRDRDRAGVAGLHGRSDRVGHPRQ
jgi:hypothetical protein